MGTPQYPKDFGTWAKSVDRRIRSATTQAQSRKPFKTIKTAILTLIGSLVVKGAGSMKVVDDNGVELVTIGRIGYSTTGAPVTGLQITRPDNTLAFSSYGTGDGSFDFNGFRDRSSTIVVSDDGVSGQGMATPWLPLPQPQSNLFAKMPGTDATTLTDIAFSMGFATHPRLRVFIDGFSDNSGAAGEFVLKVNGNQVGPTVTVPANGRGTLDGTFDLPGWKTAIPYLGTLNIVISARRTTGSTGQIYCLPHGIYAVQS